MHSNPKAAEAFDCYYDTIIGQMQMLNEAVDNRFYVDEENMSWRIANTIYAYSESLHRLLAEINNTGEFAK